MKDSNRNSNVPRFVKRIELVLKQTIMHYQPQQSQPFLKIVVALPTMVASCRGQCWFKRQDDYYSLLYIEVTIFLRNG